MMRRSEHIYIKKNATALYTRNKGQFNNNKYSTTTVFVTSRFKHISDCNRRGLRRFPQSLFYYRSLNYHDKYNYETMIIVVIFTSSSYVQVVEEWSGWYNISRSNWMFLWMSHAQKHMHNIQRLLWLHTLHSVLYFVRLHLPFNNIIIEYTCPLFKRCCCCHARRAPLSIHFTRLLLHYILYSANNWARHWTKTPRLLRQPDDILLLWCSSLLHSIVHNVIQIRDLITIS